ncbi:IS5 family transposase [Stanieria cyanosphaera]|uniref:IS5 family transposase n=1 Tax=Stanieria cyanosphaera TaxID=102116 RepID=UPI001C0A806D|nr:IS5 family transposase [Stanieria cyanosphaera]
MTYQQVKNLKATDFKRLYGVSPEVFKKMVTVVKAEKVWQKKTGRPSKLSTEDQILITLEYWREYRTYFHIAINWGINETTVLRIIRKIENILAKSELFNLPGKKVVRASNGTIETVVVDVSEHEIERPKKKQQCYYSGKQGYHTLKSQVLVDIKTKQIICTAYSKGKVHDFQIWKTSQIGIDKNIECLADKGYQGLKKIHVKSRTPLKKKKNQKLNKQEKQFNRKLAKQRIIVEHIHRCLKIFKILSSRYRNRRKRFCLRFNLIAGVYNYEIFLKNNL